MEKHSNRTRRKQPDDTGKLDHLSLIIDRMIDELPALQEALRLKELDGMTTEHRGRFLGRRTTSEPASTPTQPARRRQPRARKKQLVLVGLGNR